MTIDLNCDLGEGMPNDAAIMPHITSANIACGYHAGDEATMRKTIDLCLKHGVAIGAHPGFNDKPNFGRVPVQLPADELYELIWKQLKIIDSICKELQATLHHVKPHGALYNMAAKDSVMSRTIAQAVKDFNPDLIYYGLSGSVMISEAKALGLKTAHEVFADRVYGEDGSLLPRTLAGARITNLRQSVEQVMNLINGFVITTSGTRVALQADTVCVHGDEPGAAQLAEQLHKKLHQLRVKVQAVNCYTH
ncbi:MAG: LamB/YcsF family protein [Flammeovirgaceae bacterium]|nr:MAG: LamB/YcsF family protein [Flammeovirgaceae bacterium]